MAEKFFTYYQIDKYDSWNFEEFPDLAAIETFLSRNAANPDFQFDVICGKRVEFEAVDVVKAYRLKR